MLDATSEAMIVRRLAAPEASERIPELSSVLIDCVEGGASVSFMAPLSPAKSDAFWSSIVAGVARHERALLVAEEPRRHTIVGTVQLVLALPENQPHRAELVKLLVHRSARRAGLGSALVRAAEATALEEGRTLLMLDTVTGSVAERLYRRLGWTILGVVPGHALSPDGRLLDTTFFYKALT